MRAARVQSPAKIPLPHPSPRVSPPALATQPRHSPSLQHLPAKENFLCLPRLRDPRTRKSLINKGQRCSGSSAACRAPSSPSPGPVAKINVREEAGVPSSCRHPPARRRPPGRFKSSRFSHFPNVISGNCWRKESRRCRKSDPRVDPITHSIQRQGWVCARRGSEGAPSPPRCLFFGASLRTAGFHRVFPKANPQPLQSSPGGGRHQHKLPQSPGVTPQSSEHQHLSNSSSWFGGDAGQPVQSIPKNIPWSRERGCHGPACPRNHGLAPDVRRAPCKRRPDACLGSLLPSFLSEPFGFHIRTNLKSDPSHTWVCIKTRLSDGLRCRFVGKARETTETPGKPEFGVTMKHETRLLSCGLGFFVAKHSVQQLRARARQPSARQRIHRSEEFGYTPAAAFPGK